MEERISELEDRNINSDRKREMRVKNNERTLWETIWLP